MNVQIRPLPGFCVAVLFCAVLAIPSAVAQIPGSNVNMVSGTQWPGGDPFLQRQNEPSIAVSSRNPFHLLAGANDYRSVDLALTTNGETGDAWLGLFKSLDGGATWRSILLPGCPYDTSICNGAPSVKEEGFQAAADPMVRAGTNGMFYYSGLVFNRGFNPASAIVVSRFIDLNNKENADPQDILNGDAIQYINTSIVARGTSSQFLDKPTMAVDIPRAGANTCNLTVNQPGNETVHQSFPAGNVYVAYTAFSVPPDTDSEAVTGPQKSKIYFVRSTNCGATWSAPIALSGNGVVNQGAVIAINPVKGTVFVEWRQFAYHSGDTNQVDAMVGTVSFDGGRTFSAPVHVSTFTPFDEGTTNTSFRTNAYPTAAVDGSGRIYEAYSARNVDASGDARIVLTSSLDGLHWTKAVPVDVPPVDPLTNPSGRGHQIMPALTFAAGHLSLLFYDLRLDHTFGLFTPLLNLGQPTGLYSEFPELAGELGLTPPVISSVFNQYIDDSTITLRRHTFDLRMAQALPGMNPIFAPSVLVSQYAYGCCAANQTDIEQMQFNVPNLPLFRSGTAPFMGDYVDLSPAPLFLPPSTKPDGDVRDADSDDWRFNLSSSTPTIFHAAWTDNRDVQPPADGDWTHYTPPNSPSLGTTSIFQPGTTVPACQAGFTGSRNQNIYTAPISNGLVFGAPSNTKRLGTTVFNGQTVPFQRAFAVVAQNTTNVVKSFRLTILNQPTGGNASFLQFSQLTTLDLSIPPLSSATRPVFVTSTSPTASVTITIAEITAPAGTLVPNGLTGSTTLNPDPTNPTITNPAISNPAISNPAISNFEVTNPAISNPAISNPAISNASITNPAISNPAISNSSFQNISVVNPSVVNPAISNPAISNASIANPAISNPAISNVNPTNTSVSDTQWSVTNTGNTSGAYTINLASNSPVPVSNVLQLIISKLYQTPAAPTGQDCNLKIETQNIIVTNIVKPVLLNPTNPAISNTGITNPAISNATVALAPGETANIIIRVVNTDKLNTPTFNPAASVVPVTVSQSVNTQTALASNGGGGTPPTPVSVPPLIITNSSLSDGVAGAAYAQTIGTQGGNPTSHTFSVVSGALPTGLTLSTTTGAITGVPAATGSFTFTVQAQDVAIPPILLQNTAKQSLNIRIAAPLALSSASLPNGTQGTQYSQTLSTTGGILPVTLTLTTGTLPPGLTFGSPTISGTPTAPGPFSFSIQVADSSNPPQILTQAYTINIAPLAVGPPANVAFVSQPQNSIGGQTLGGSPVVVSVTDATGAPISAANVTLSFNGTPPCSSAVLGGTLTQTTNAAGVATFPNLTVDRGQFGYTLLATTGNITAVSNPFSVQSFCPSANLSTQREVHTQVLLGNGKVLIAGGVDNTGTPLNTAELYDPATGTLSPTGNLSDPNGRANQASIVLPNGNVLLVGGLGGPGASPIATAELYDPISGTFSPTGSMLHPREAPTAVLLADGRVLVSGGFKGTITLNTAEIYDPATGLFTSTGNMSQNRARHATALLPNGKVLFAGGWVDVGASFGVYSSAEIFDPTANQGVGAFTSIANMNVGRAFFTSTLLSNGTVLLTGGFAGGNTGPSHSSAEIFDPATGLFTLTGSMSATRARHTATLLPDGTVLLIGGGDAYPGAVDRSSADIYSPATGSFASTGPMTTGRERLGSTLLNDGNVFVSGGDDGVNVLSSTEVYYNTSAVSPLAITTTSLPSGFVSQPYVQLLLEQGGLGTLTWSVASGTLPSGITLGTNGILSGTPTAAGSFSFAVQITDSSSPARTATSGTLTIKITLATLAFTSNTMPTAGAGRAYSQPLPVTGGTKPYNATVTGGTVPPGMSLGSNGVLSGTPASAGVFTFTVNVVDSSATPQTATQTLTIAINTLFITTTVLADGIVGVSYNAAISTAGGTLPLSFSLTTTAFPPGLTIQQPAANSHSGALAGTPTTAGTFTFSESVADSSNPAQTATQNYTVTILPIGTSGPATVTFLRQPVNSVGGRLLTPGPLVSVTDANNTPIVGASVALSFNGAPPCSSAVLSGTLYAFTNAAGRASFPDLSIDRGQVGYTLLASAGSASALSQPFTVNGFCATGSMATARALLDSVTLQNGKVLIAGGAPAFNNQAVAFSSAELYDPVAHSFAPVGGMHAGRSSVSMAVLQSGLVLVAGGFSGSGVLSSAELFDPATNTFTLLPGSMVTARDLGVATLLANGKVLITGGVSNVGVLASAEIFDPATNTFTATSQPMTTPRWFHAAGLLPNGKVLITGGASGSSATGPSNSLTSAEIYDPVTDTFTSTGSMASTRYEHASALLFTGKVLVSGGFSGNNFTVPSATAEIYDPSTGTFSSTQASAGSLYPVPVLPDGTVFLYTGANAQIYDPTAGTFRGTGNTITIQEQPETSLLNDGTVLVAGGVDLTSTGVANAQIYYSTAPFGPMQVTTPTTGGSGPSGTTVFTDPISFASATSGAATTGFNGIIPAGATFAGFNPLVVNGISFSTPLSTSGVLVNVTRSTNYTPNVYPADFIVNSVIPATGVSSANNTLTITLPSLATAFAMDFGGLGFKGASTATITLSNGFALPLSSLPTAGHTQFRGFVSATPFNTITFSTVNDDFVVLDVLVAGADTVLPGAAVGQPYTQVLLEQGGVGSLTWTLASGTLPSGITLRTDGVLIGTPRSGGTFTFTVNLVDSSNPPKSTTSNTFSLTVSTPFTPLVFAPQTLPTAFTGSAYTASLVASGGTTPYSFLVTSGSLPTGISLAGNGQFSGTPTSAGTSTFTITVTDSSVPAQSASQTFTIKVVNPLAITTVSLPNAVTHTAGQPATPYSAQIATSGGAGGAVNFTVISGALPSSITLNATTGVLSSASVTDSSGPYNFTIQAVSAGPPSSSATQAFTLTLVPLFAGTTPNSLPGGTVAVPYSQNLTSIGGAAPFTYQLAPGITGNALPPGLTITSPANSTVGQLSGTPTQAGTFTFTIQATDSSTPAQSYLETLTITIAPAVVVPAHIAFISQPQNSVEGQTLQPSPVQVLVTDNTNAPVPNVNVTMGFNGAPPCSAATLGGTLKQTTDATGTATFSNLTIDRGQFGYTLAAVVPNIAAVSSTPFNVEGFCDTGSLATARAFHSSVALPNGKILVAGGTPNPSGNAALSSAELFDPATHTFTTISSMNVARVDFTMTLLQNGLVLIAGGFDGSTAASSAELFDPATNTFTLLSASMVASRYQHVATLLSNGKVLITGGKSTSILAVASAELFDPSTNSFTASAQAMTSARTFHEVNLLANGRVLISGGIDASGNSLASAELYDPVSDTFTATGSMATAREQHAAALLFNGTVLVGGGDSGTATSATPNATAEIYDPAAGTFTSTGSETQSLAGFVTPVPVLADGSVFFAQGQGPGTVQIYDPVAGTFRATGNMSSSQFVPQTALLPDGTVLLSAGQLSFPNVTSNAQIFYPINLPSTITITLTVLPTAQQNQPYTQQLLEKGGIGTLTWRLTPTSNPLPTGMALSPSGILSGTPTTFGAFTFTVQVTDSSVPAKTATITYAFVVNPFLQFVGNQLFTALSGVPYNNGLPLVGGTTPYTTILAAGTLPAGLTFANGTINGTTTALGTYTLTFQATDSSTPQQSATGTFTLGVTTPLAFVTTTLPNGAVGSSYSATISTTGGLGIVTMGPTANTLPPGLTLSAQGVLSGNPTTTGTFNFTVVAADQSLPTQTATQSFTVTVATATAPISLSPNPLSLLANNTGVMTVTLSSPAGANGQVVTLVSSNSNVASAPANVTVPAGLSSVGFQVTAGATAGSATITASVPGATSGSATVVVTTRPMSLTTDGPLLAINRSFNATVTLAQPVPAGSVVTVTLTANPSGLVSISPATQNIAGGQTTAVFALTAGASGGSVVLTASASGFSNATAPLTITSNLISFGAIPVLAPAQSASLPVSLSFAAPPGGLTINFASTNTSVATITPSVFVPAGLLIPAANPQVTGVTIGSTQITASAVGFAPDSGAVTVTVTDLVSPNPINVNATRTVNVTLTISAAAPAGGITFNLASDNTSIATVPATVTVPQGQLSVTFGVTGVAQGSAHLSVSSPGIATISVPINVGAPPAINLSNQIVGNNLIIQGNISLSVAPTSAQTMTITSGDPTHLLLSTDPAKVGTASITLQLNPLTTGVPAFYLQGQNFSGTASIDVTLTATSAGYTNGTSTVSVYPSGLTYLFSSGLTTTTFSQPSTLTVYLVVLSPGTLTFYTYGQTLGPQALAALPVAVTSTNTSVGTVTGSPTSIAVGSYFTQAISFQPVAAGTTNLNLATPTGYSTPANAPVQLATTVTAPAISLNGTVVGNNLIVQGGASLAANPPSNETLTLTSSDPTHFLLTTDPAKVGTASITLQLTGGSGSVPVFYVEGQNFSGTTAITATLTASAPGYANGTTTLTLYPSGLTYLFGGGVLNTTTFSQPSTLTVYLVVLSPGTLTFYTYGQTLGPQAPAAVPVAITSTNTSVGTVSGSPASISVGAYFSQGISFQPVAAGTTNLNLATPTGYFTPSNVPVQLVTTVTAPAITLSSPIVGSNLVTNVSASLAAAPPSNETLTLTSSDPAHFLLTTDPAKVGTASITLQLTAGSFTVPTFYVEGQNFSGTTAITATLTASAPGYANGTSTLTLYPSGLAYLFSGGTLNTTTFSQPSTLAVYLVVLSPGTLTFYTYGQPVGPQAPGASVPVAVSNSIPSVGTLTGSPASIAVGAYFTQAISFKPATAGVTNLNLATPTGYFTPSNQPVQLVTTVTAPAITLGSPVVGNNMILTGSLSLAAAPPSNETLTLTSSDPAHFLLTTDPAKVGTASITLQLTTGSFTVPTFYIEGQNFSGVGAITATLTASAAGYSDGTGTMTLYPTGLTYLFNSTLTTTTTSGPTQVTVYLVLLTPGTLTFYTYGYTLGPQAPGAVPVVVTSSSAAVGTISGSPASISVGTYFTSAISFQPLATGTTNLNLATPTGYFTPSNQPVQIVATVQ